MNLFHKNKAPVVERKVAQASAAEKIILQKYRIIFKRLERMYPVDEKIMLNVEKNMKKDIAELNITKFIASLNGKESVNATEYNNLKFELLKLTNELRDCVGGDIANARNKEITEKHLAPLNSEKQA